LLGAVYKPVPLTVPSVALPPAVPFTDHATFVVALPVTVTLNACVPFTVSVKATLLATEVGVTDVMVASGAFSAAESHTSRGYHSHACNRSDPDASPGMPQVDSGVFLSPRPESCRENSNRLIKLWWD
jgi:hypothetical protein